MTHFGTTKIGLLSFLSGLVRTDAYGQVNFPFEINRPMEVGEVLQVTEGTPLIYTYLLFL